MTDGAGWITFRQSATGGTVTTPITAPLPGWAESLSTDQVRLRANLRRDAPQWIKMQTGAPRSVEGCRIG